ncbi:MAG: TonB-dependent receptor, partial [Candidatus Eremiobacteraeota bacterium]|nr:TonB-dependent receptor [Candidatus Eremiobacteraeota bacterium]
AGQSDVSRFDAVAGLGPCPAGFASRATNPFTNTTGGTTSATVLQPRIAFTYAAGPNTVLRGSYGRYARPAATSYQQYNTYQQDLPSFLGQFSALGYTTPNHDVRPDTSDNFDFSYERRLGNFSLKASPFYRSTKNQLQYLNISALGGTLAGVNVGTLRSYGLEFSGRYRDFDQEGFAAQLSYTFTHTRIKYNNFSNGRNVIDVLNDSIQKYNSYTSACAPAGPADPVTGAPTYAPSQTALCGNNANAVNGSATFAGLDQSGGATTIPNIYYNNNAQTLMDRNADYVPYDVIPSPFASANSYAVPNVASLILSYKHRKLTVTPSFTYSSGGYYGSPLSVPGIVPQACTPPAGTAPLDTTSATPGLYCGSGGSIFIPDSFTGNRFDSMGALRQPSQLTMNLQVAYDVSPKSTLTLIATGLYNQCYQRGYAWDTSTACVYSSLPSNILPPSGNFLSAAATPKQLLYPYGLWFNNTQVGITSAKQPFNMVINYAIKL